MLYPDHHTRRLLVAEHRAQLERLAARPPATTVRRFTMTELARPQAAESRRRWFAWRRSARRAAQGSPLAAFAAVAVAATAFAVPTAAACPLDPDDTCLVRSTGTHDWGAAAPARQTPAAKPAKPQAKPKPRRALPRTLLPHRGGV